MLSAIYTLESTYLSDALLLALVHWKSLFTGGSGEKHRQAGHQVKRANAKAPSHLFSQRCLEKAGIHLYILQHVRWVSYFFKESEIIDLILAILNIHFFWVNEI